MSPINSKNIKNMPISNSVTKSNMKSVLVLAVAVVAAVQAFNPITAPLKATNAAITGSLDLSDSSVQLATNLTSQGLQQGIDIGKKMVGAEQQLTSTGIQGGANLANQALGVVNNVTEEFPPFGSATSAVTGVLSNGINLTNSAAQAALAGANNAANFVLDHANDAGQNVISGVSSGSNALFGKLSDTSNKFFKSIIDKIPFNES